VDGSLMGVHRELGPMFGHFKIFISYGFVCLHMKYLRRMTASLNGLWIGIDRKAEMKGIGPGGSQATADEATASLLSLEDKILNQYNFAKVLHLTSLS